MELLRVNVVYRWGLKIIYLILCHYLVITYSKFYKVYLLYFSMGISRLERMAELRIMHSFAWGTLKLQKQYKETLMETINPFSIIPKVYEAELDNKYGIVLGAIKNGEKSKFQGNLEKNISFNGGDDYSVQQIDNEILKKYKFTPEFCSMNIKSMEQLIKHVKKIHELSYGHYVFGKESNMKGQFPDYCCINSSRNLFLILMSKGYPNSSYFYNYKHDHAYVGLPFLFGENQEKGFIIIDPTSDQLFYDKRNAPRNNLFVVSGIKWKYETDWKGGQDLYPNSDNGSVFSNLHTLKKHQFSSIYESGEIDKYFKKVFKNSVDVNIESF